MGHFGTAADGALEDAAAPLGLSSASLRLLRLPPVVSGSRAHSSHLSKSHLVHLERHGVRVAPLTYRTLVRRVEAALSARKDRRAVLQLALADVALVGLAARAVQWAHLQW